MEGGNVMSSEIDRRIVEMQFDNKQFEKGIQTSVRSLEKLKQNLDLEKSVKGLSSLEKAGRSLNLSGVSDSVAALSNRFSAMGIIGMTALQNIANSAYNCGKRMLSAFTVDPIKTGFAEYETQIGAIQTILANTSDAMDKLGYGQQQRLDIVNGKLDELNRYADKTIYNFTEMTRNIGTFTAAGVDLDTSVSSIKGIANLAAVSGSTSQQASTAMYQLSQAISTGTVRLMDWNSVVNAGMGGELFQKALMRTASNMKIVGEEAQETFAELQAGNISFRDSLQSGWLTSDVLTATLSQISMDFEQIAKDNGLFLANGAADIEAAKNLMRSALSAEGYGSDEIEEIISLAETATEAATKVKTVTQLFDTMKESVQSGWTQTWEYIIGDFEEAKEFLTNLSDYFGGIIGASADSRNAMMADWKALGGRNELINSLWNIIHTVENIAGTVKNAFTEFFPSTTGQQLFDLTKKLNDFTARIKAATENSELMGKVGRVFRGMAAGLDIVRDAAGWAWNGFKKLIGMSDGVAGSFLDFAAGVGDWVVNLRKSIEESTLFQGILSGIGDAATAVRTGVTDALTTIGSHFSTLWTKIEQSGIFTTVGQWLNDTIALIPKGIERIRAFGSSIVEWVQNSETLKSVWDNVKKFFTPLITGITGFGTKLGEAIQSFFGADTGEGSFWDKVQIRFAAFGEKIGEWFNGIRPTIENAWNTAKVAVGTFFTKTIPEFFTNLKMKLVLKWPWLDQVFAFFENVATKISNTLSLTLTKLNELWLNFRTGIENLFGGNDRLDGDSVTFGEAVKEALLTSWESIKTFFGNFITVTIPRWFDKLKGIDWGSIIKMVLGAFTGVKLISAISGIGKLGQGLSSIGIGLKGVGKMLKDVGENGLTLTKVIKNKDSFATSLLKIAGAIGILVGSVVVLANMEVGKATKGIGLLTLLSMELLTITAIFKKIDANGDALIKAAGAVALLMISVFLLGRMDIGTALKGILGVGIILTELALFMRIAGKGMTGKQSFLGLAVAVNLLVLAVKSLGDMDLGSAIKGIAGLGLVMLELSLFMGKTNTTKITGMISMAVAMNLLVRAVRKMGSLNTKTIAKGILGMGGIMAAFAVLIRTTKGMKFGSAVTMLLSAGGMMLLFVEMFKQVEGMDTGDMMAFAASLAVTMLSLSAAMKIISTIPITGALTGLGSFAILIVGIGGIIAALGWLQNEWAGMTNFLEGGGNVLGQIGRALGNFVGGIGGGIVEGMDLPQLGTDLSDFMANAQGFIDGAKNVKAETATGVLNLTKAIGSIAGTEFKSWLVSLFTGENPITSFSDDIQALGRALSGYAFAVLPMALVPQAVLDRSVSVATALAGVAQQIPATGGVMTLINGIGDLGTFSTNVKSLGTGLADFAAEISEIDDSKFNQTKIDAVVAVATGLASLESSLEGQGGLEDAIEGVKSLSKFGEGMESFGAGLNDFITEVKKIEYNPEPDEKKLYAVMDIATALSTLEKNLEAQGGWADAIEGIKSLSGFSTGMEPFATGLNSFIEQVKQIDYDPEKDGEKLYAVMDIGAALSTLEKNLEAQGGWADAIAGIKSLSGFGGELPDFASGLNSFIEQTSTLDNEKYDATKIQNALNVANAINELNKALPSTDGWVQGIMGTQDLGLFSENIKKVGEALSSFSTNVSGTTINQAEDAVTALDVIRVFTSTLSAEGGLWNDIGKFFGGSQENTLLGYAKNMATVGTDLNTFSTMIENVKIDNIGKASEVIDAIGGFVSGLTKSGGVFESIGAFFDGSKGSTLITLSGNMATFGSSIGMLAAGIANIDTTSTNFEGAKLLFENFKAFNDTVSQYGDIEYSDQMSDLLRILDVFGYSLSSFGTSLSTTDVTSLSTAASIIETLVNLAGSAAGIDAANVANISSILEEYGKISLAGFVTGFNAVSGDAVNAVNGMIAQIVLAIQNDTSVKTSAMVLSISTATAIRSANTAWYNAGTNLGRGLARGISAMAGTIRSAAVGAAQGAINAIRITWSIHSPSKVGEGLGEYWDLGIAKGMNAYSYLIDRSATDIGDNAVTAAQSVLNNMNRLTDSIDAEPTIRPVLDLSDITNGVNTLDGLFNGNRTLNSTFFSGLSSVRSARAMIQEQTASMSRSESKEIVAELQKLSKQFEELSEAVENMQIVLDTGTLVGQTSAKMDAQLGTAAARRERAN
jgi:tape measure domain-containing protein